MITEEYYLLLCLAEECMEVGQRITKALRFTLDEVQDGQMKSNRDRLFGEVNDLIALLSLYVVKFTDGIYPTMADVNQQVEKQKRYQKYAEYSRKLGILG